MHVMQIRGWNPAIFFVVRGGAMWVNLDKCMKFHKWVCVSALNVYIRTKSYDDRAYRAVLQCRQNQTPLQVSD